MSAEQICLLDACEHAFVVNTWFGAVTALAALTAVLIAWYQLASARHEEAVRATFALIEEETKSGIKTSHDFSDFIREHDLDPKKIADAMAGDRFAGKSTGVQAAFALMNHREYVGTLLRFKGGDLQTYLRWNFVDLPTEWDALSGYILTLRQQTNTSFIFCDFEWLVQQARAYAVKVRESS
jgi:hypothetical protein